ncbi:MAG: hypothetical protein IPP17_11045 [Bacteroidetes bacterium]|nr:hypothetical protein [Bacteroidota bacterium]
MNSPIQEMWDARYGAPEWAYGTEPNVYFRDKLSGLIPGKILLPAEGEGRNAAFAASRGWSVEAFDLSVEGKTRPIDLQLTWAAASNTWSPMPWRSAIGRQAWT